MERKYIKEKWLRSENFFFSLDSNLWKKWCTTQNYGRINADFHCFGDLAVWLIFWFHKARLPKHWILNGASNKKEEVKRSRLIPPFKFKSAPSIKPNATHLKMGKKKRKLCMWWKFFQLLRAFSCWGKKVYKKIKSKNILIFLIPYYLYLIKMHNSFPQIYHFNLFIILFIGLCVDICYMLVTIIQSCSIIHTIILRNFP